MCRLELRLTKVGKKKYWEKVREINAAATLVNYLLNGNKQKARQHENNNKQQQ